MKRWVEMAIVAGFATLPKDVLGAEVAYSISKTVYATPGPDQAFVVALPKFRPEKSKVLLGANFDYRAEVEFSASWDASRLRSGFIYVTQAFWFSPNNFYDVTPDGRDLGITFEGFHLDYSGGDPLLIVSILPGQIGGFNRLQVVENRPLNQFDRDDPLELLVGTEDIEIPIQFGSSGGFEGLGDGQFTADQWVNARFDFQVSYLYAVPEPHTWLLLTTGMGMTGAMMRRRGPARNPVDASELA